MDFCDRCNRHFIGQGYNSTANAHHYLSGLTGIQGRKKVETIENNVKGSDYQSMVQFISSSPWSHGSLPDDIARGADGQFGQPEEASLIYDESSFLKKSKASVGCNGNGVVARAKSKTEYSLTNLPDPRDWQRNLSRQNQRFWIEHAFHEAKSQTSMAQYQVRVLARLVSPSGPGVSGHLIHGRNQGTPPKEHTAAEQARVAR